MLSGQAFDAQTGAKHFFVRVRRAAVSVGQRRQIEAGRLGGRDELQRFAKPGELTLGHAGAGGAVQGQRIALVQRAEQCADGLAVRIADGRFAGRHCVEEKQRGNELENEQFEKLQNAPKRFEMQTSGGSV